MSINQDLQRTFLEYGEAVSSRNNRATLDLLYPKLFDIIPRKRMEAGLEAAQEDNSVDVKISDFGIERIVNEWEIAGTNYTAFESTCRIILKFPLSDIDKVDDDDNEEESAEFRYEFFKEKYGEANVSFDRKQNIVKATTKNLMLGIREDQQWRFLEIKDPFMEMYRKFLPAAVSDELARLIPPEEPIEWPKEDETPPEKINVVEDFPHDKDIDVIYLLGWDVFLNGDSDCEDFLHTQVTDKETFEYASVGLELIFHKKKLKSVNDYSFGEKKVRKLKKEEKALLWKKLEPHTLLNMKESPDGIHSIGGDVPASFQLPKSKSVAPFQYLGFVDNSDPNFAWLPFRLHLTHAIYLNIDKIFLDYTDPLSPVIINKKDVEDADTSHDELNADSWIVFEQAKYNFIRDVEFSYQGSGGIPKWIQAPAIPTCPRSGKRMRFVLQTMGGVATKKTNIKSDDYFQNLEFWGDGELFVFFEPESKVACYLIQNT